MSAKDGKRSPHGTSRFLTWWEKLKALNRLRKGFTLDGRNRISKKRSFQNLVVVAGTGSGKTTTVCIPSILNASGSIVCTDPSGEIYKATAGWLSGGGYDIKVVNPTQPHQSLCFNPLIRAHSESDIMKIGQVLVDAATSGEYKGDRFWVDGARGIITFFIKALKSESEAYQNLANVLCLLNSFGSNGSVFDQWINHHPDKSLWNTWQGIISNPEKTLQGFLSTAKTALEKVSDPDIAAVTARETLNFETIRQRKTAIFLQIPENEIRYYSFFTTLFYTQLFNFLMKMPHPSDEDVFIIGEEWGNQAAIPGFSSLITTTRKRRIAVMMVLQSLSQMDDIYGANRAKTILGGGCLNHLYLAGLSHDMCRQLQDLLGKTTIEIKDSHGSSHNASRNLLNADEIRTMPSSSGLYIYNNQYPAWLTMKPWYKNEALKPKGALDPPPLPVNEVVEIEYFCIPHVGPLQGAP